MSTPDAPADAGYTTNLVAFCSALRDRGVPVATDRVVTGARAISEVDALDRRQFYGGLKAALIADPRHEAIFDELFAEYWDDRYRGLEGDGAVTEGGVDLEATAGDATDPAESLAEPAEPPSQPPPLAGSPLELQETDAAQLGEPGARSIRDDTVDEDEFLLEIGRQERSTTPEAALDRRRWEAEALALLVGELGRALGTMPGVATRPSARGAVDLRRSLRVSRGDHPGDLPRLDRVRSETRARLFVDVSHSMLRNMDRAFLLRFLFECRRQFADARIFFFDTTATEVTAHFDAADLDRTLEQMRRTRTEWGAGTTIGACLERILATDPFLVDLDTVVIVISDGWDAGEPDRLEAQLRRIVHRSRSLIWLNPLAASPRYEPKVSGMRTTMPYLDHFYGFADADDLRAVVDGVRNQPRRSGTAPRGPVSARPARR